MDGNNCPFTEAGLIVKWCLSCPSFFKHRVKIDAILPLMIGNVHHRNKNEEKGYG